MLTLLPEQVVFQSFAVNGSMYNSFALCIHQPSLKKQIFFLDLVSLKTP